MDLLRDYTTHSITRYAFARHALVEALGRSSVVADSRVLVPEFICRDVLASIHARGASVSFYEVNESLDPVNLESAPRAQAVLAVNYFGFPQDLSPYREYCANHDARLIEDNAHGLFSRDHTGALLGTRGDYGILSMRKTFHVSTGAALIAPAGDSPAHATPCDRHADSSLDWFRFVLSRGERKTGLPLMPAMRSVIRGCRRLAGKPALSLSSAREEHELPTQQIIGCASNRLLNRQSPDREASRRRQLFNQIAPEISAIDGVAVLHHQLADGVVPYGVPFRAAPRAAERVEKIARRYHVSTMTWPALPESVLEKAPDHYRNIWLVNFI